MVCKLEAEGFTRAQAQAVTRVLVDTLRSSVKLEAEGLVPRAEVDRRLLSTEAKIESLASGLREEVRNAVSLRKEATGRIETNVEKVEARTREEFQKAKANQRLDMNLERSRAKEELRQTEDKFSDVTKQLESMLHDQQKEMEKMKLDIIKGVMGVVATAGGLGIGLWRLALAVAPSAPPPQLPQAPSVAAPMATGLRE
eukprot:SAG22_NODE_1473_length_4341_cov_30.519566_1_plen_199_part_00